MDAGERLDTLGGSLLWASAGLGLAAAVLGGTVAVTCGLLAGLALLASYSIAASRPGDSGDRPAPLAARAVRPDQAAAVEIDAPAPARPWCDRIEHPAAAAKRSR